jgi:hypothetical protein
MACGGLGEGGGSSEVGVVGGRGGLRVRAELMGSLHISRIAKIEN